jgi:hypothetical protein
MSDTITLPSGGTVTFMDFDDLRGRHRAAVEIAVAEAAHVSNAADNTVAICKLAELVIESWNIPYLPDAKIPGEVPDNFGELRPPDWSACVKAMRPAIAILYPGDPKPDDAGVPGTPTLPDGG